MESMHDTTQISCPYCGQTNQIYIDYSGGKDQIYDEDCQVCCRPWEVHVQFVKNQPEVTVVRSDE